MVSKNRPLYGRFSAHLGQQIFNLEMKTLDCSRKLDSMGRITIPIRLREQLGFEIGHEYSYYLFEENGMKFLCIKCPDEPRADD